MRTARRRAPLRPRPRTPGILAAVLLVGLIPGWLGLAGRFHWLLDLYAHFRWQYLLYALLVLGAGLWLRHRPLIATAAATMLLNGVVIGRSGWEGARAPALAADVAPLRVLGLNVRTSNTAKQQVLDYLLGVDADVLFLMEVDEAWLSALSPLEDRYPNRFRHPRPDNFGLALYSRVATTRTSLLELGETAMPTVEALLQHQGRRFHFIGTHPVPPMGSAMAQSRDQQLDALARHVAAAEEPVLVVGDLNATPWSVGVSTLQRSGLAFGRDAPPWAPTWRARSPLAIPIDHALATAPLVIADREVGPEVGSDHRPVLYTLAWSAP